MTREKERGCPGDRHQTGREEVQGDASGSMFSGDDVYGRPLSSRCAALGPAWAPATTPGPLERTRPGGCTATSLRRGARAAGQGARNADRGRRCSATGGDDGRASGFNRDAGSQGTQQPAAGPSRRGLRESRAPCVFGPGRRVPGAAPRRKRSKGGHGDSEALVAVGQALRLNSAGPRRRMFECDLSPRRRNRG